MKYLKYWLPEIIFLSVFIICFYLISPDMKTFYGLVAIIFVYVAMLNLTAWIERTRAAKKNSPVHPPTSL